LIDELVLFSWKNFLVQVCLKTSRDVDNFSETLMTIIVSVFSFRHEFWSVADRTLAFFLFF